MTYTYFTSFYHKIHDALLTDPGIVSSSSSLSSTCQNDSNRVNLYLGEINDSKWSESGTIFVKNNIISSIKKNIKDLSQFIDNNLVTVCSISINSLLPSLKDMKKNDELLYAKKQELNRKRSSLSYLQNNIPAKYETGKDGYEHISDAYIQAINAINALASEINSLTVVIKNLISLLDGLKTSSDGYISQISGLGDESIAIPGYTLDRDNLVKDLIPLDMANYPYIDETSIMDTFNGGTFEKVEINGVGCRIYIPNGYKVTDKTQLTVYLTGCGDRGEYFSTLSSASDYGSVKNFPKGPVLIVVTDSFKYHYQHIYNPGNDAKLDSIISQAKASMGITTPKVSIVAYSLGNDLFAKYITGYGSTVDKAVLINPCGNALGKLTSPDFAAPYSNVGEVQIIQADRETVPHIGDDCYILSDKLAESSNTSKAYFSGDHGDYEKALSATYPEPTEVSRQIRDFVPSTESYIDPNFNIWDYV